MSEHDKNGINKILKKIEIVEAKNIKLYYRMEKILSQLEDDPKSNSKGLISKVNDLDNQVEKLLIMSSAARKVTIFIVTVLTGLTTYAAKLIFFK
tara:strand:- start:5154 stop:5438 length:285 start_codon:yes stop_codon:yes gene_type:complete